VLDVFAPSPEPFAVGLHGDPGPRRIAVTFDPPYGGVDEECAKAARDVAELLGALGHAVTDATPAWATILEAATGPMTSPGPAGLVPIELVDQLEPRNRPLLEAGHRLTVVDHARWVELVRSRSLEFLRFWDNLDVLVTPTSGVLPPPVDFVSWDLPREEQSARFLKFPLPHFAQPFNLTGQPAISLPLAMGATGLPIGVQLVGRRGAEVTLLQLARQLEVAQPWSDRRPSDVLGGAVA
jgi:Asp-tRNA(Asn)/Glu-tRNA(Gln) amidotransferase A subunit family amidase